jgi:serine protease inhibitor
LKTKNISTGVSDELAVALLRAELESHPGSNIVVSPLSVSLALGCLLNGKRPEARKEASLALGFNVGRSLRGINESYSELRAALAQNTELDLDLANALYGNSDLEFKQNFLNKAQQYFDARISLLDFQDPSSVVLMNSFICQKTKGKIASVVDALESDEGRMLLLNAFFLHGHWKHGFNRLLTQAEEFYRLDGQPCHCALMYRRGLTLYTENLKFQAVKLPYGESARFSMYAILPLAQGAFGISAVLDLLANEGISSYFPRFTSRQCELFLPRFRVEYSSRLNESLSKLGFADTFCTADEDASSAARSKCGHKCGQHVTLQHKAVVEVDEAGTDKVVPAREASESGPMRCMFVPFGKVRVRFDRPFFFFVRDEQTETITAAGYINNPGEPLSVASEAAMLAANAGVFARPVELVAARC